MHRPNPNSILDLRGTTCPMAFVKTKIHLDQVTPGETVRIVFEPTPANEPLVRSIRSLGHHILSETHTNALDLPDILRQDIGTPPSADVQLTILKVEVKA
jgi:TusA-related sulfurtransferase